MTAISRPRRYSARAIENLFQCALLAMAITWLFFNALVFGAERSFHYEYALILPFIVYMFMKGVAARDFPLHWIIPAFLIFSAYATLSSLWSLDPDRTLATGQRIIMIAVCLPGIWLFIRKPQNLLIFAKMHTGIAAVSAVLGAVFFVDAANREFIGFGPAITGMLYFAGAVSGFVAYMLDHRRIHYVACIALCLMPIILVGSVRAALAVACVAFFMAIANMAPPWRRVSMGKVLLRIAVFALLIGAGITAMYMLGDQLGARVSRNAEFATAVAEGADPYSLGGPAIRIVLYLEGLQILRDSFSWFGHGLHATYSLMADRLGVATYTHVDHLEILIGLGLIGSALYFSTLFLPWLSALRTAGLTKLPRGFIFGVGAGVFVLSLTGRLYTSLSVWVVVIVTLAFPVAALFYSGERVASRATTPGTPGDERNARSDDIA